MQVEQRLLSFYCGGFAGLCLGNLSCKPQVHPHNGFGVDGLHPGVQLGKDTISNKSRARYVSVSILERGVRGLSGWMTTIKHFVMCPEKKTKKKRDVRGKQNTTRHTIRQTSPDPENESTRKHSFQNRETQFYFC